MIKKEIATLGAGCFWGVELEFSKVKGVLSTSVGYMGGNDKYKNPTYEQVCTDKTGYAEIVQIVFDPNKVSYKKLLDVFWEIHDPTSLNRQGFDIGTQYRSVIFYHSKAQKKEAIKSRNELQKKLGTNKKIVTGIVKASKYYLAEEYHQHYLKKRGLKVCLI